MAFRVRRDRSPAVVLKHQRKRPLQGQRPFISPARAVGAPVAPEIFDTAVVRRRDEEREAHRQRLIELEPIMQKVYGPVTDSPPEELHHAQTDGWCGNGAEMVQFSPCKVQEIESLLAERELWMTVGVVARARHQTLQPHRRVNLSLMARLVDLASKLGRLTVGMELRPNQTRARPRASTKFSQESGCTEKLH